MRYILTICSKNQTISGFKSIFYLSLYKNYVIRWFFVWTWCCKLFVIYVFCTHTSLVLLRMHNCTPNILDSCYVFMVLRIKKYLLYSTVLLYSTAVVRGVRNRTEPTEFRFGRFSKNLFRFGSVSVQWKIIRIGSVGIIASAIRFGFGSMKILRIGSVRSCCIWVRFGFGSRWFWFFFQYD